MHIRLLTCTYAYLVWNISKPIMGVHRVLICPNLVHTNPNFVLIYHSWWLDFMTNFQRFVHVLQWSPFSDFKKNCSLFVWKSVAKALSTLRFWILSSRINQKYGLWIRFYYYNYRINLENDLKLHYY